MKKVIMTLILSLLAGSIYAQKVAKYCLVRATPGVYGAIEIKLEVSDKGFKDASVIQNLKRVEKFKFMSDVADLFVSSGWTLEQTYGLQAQANYLFKKEFDAAELTGEIGTAKER